MDHQKGNEQCHGKYIERLVPGHSPRSLDVSENKVCKTVSKSAGTHDKEYRRAIVILCKMNKKFQDNHEAVIEYPVMTSEEKDLCEFSYYVTRQFMIVKSTQRNESNEFSSTDGCIHVQCLCCALKIFLKQSWRPKKKIDNFWEHLVVCSKIPKSIKNALKTLETFRKWDLEQGERAHEQSHVINVIAQQASAKSPSPENCSRKSEEEFYLSGRDLPEMHVFDRQKKLSSDHYPTLTFTAWNEKEGK
jgi:hypothetical protein